VQVCTRPARGASRRRQCDAGYRAVEYLDDVAARSDAATLVLAAGGASTLAEIAAARAAGARRRVPAPQGPPPGAERARAQGAGVRVVPEEAARSALVGTLARLAGAEGSARTRDEVARVSPGASRATVSCGSRTGALLVAHRFGTRSIP
jgi:hypothetical protein